MTPERREELVKRSWDSIAMLGHGGKRSVPEILRDLIDTVVAEAMSEFLESVPAIEKEARWVTCPTCSCCMPGQKTGGTHRHDPDCTCGGTGSISRELAEVLELLSKLPQHLRHLDGVVLRDWARAREEPRRKGDA